MRLHIWILKQHEGWTHQLKVIRVAQREVQRLEIISEAPLRSQLPCHLNKFPWG